MRSAATPSPRLSPRDKVRLAARIWHAFLLVHLGLRRHSLPDLARRLAARRRRGAQTVDPVRLGRIVYRVLRVGPYRPRCLVSSLVAFRLLREQGVDAELVIGLPDRARTKDAHSWVEVHRKDVGPPPGRGTRIELVRYPETDARGTPASAS